MSFSEAIQYTCSHWQQSSSAAFSDRPPKHWCLVLLPAATVHIIVKLASSARSFVLWALLPLIAFSLPKKPEDHQPPSYTPLSSSPLDDC